MKRNSIFYKKYLLNLIKKYLNTKKRILNKIKKFNHKDNILKNIKIYELTPTNQINDYTYLEYLEAAINKKNITKSKRFDLKGSETIGNVSNKTRYILWT